MDNEEKRNIPTNFGKVIDALHNKSPLPSLRTYQGDMAEFIKEKNESVVSIAVKEKTKKEEQVEERKREPRGSVGSNIQINLTILLSSLILIVGAAAVSLYVFKVVREKPVGETSVEEAIIPYNNVITLANIASADFKIELKRLSPSGGVSLLKVSDTNGTLFPKAKKFFNFLNLSLPPTLERVIEDEYILGVVSQGGQISNFLVITVSDFGRAFSAMLDWEANLVDDLSFLSSEENTVGVATTTVIANESSFRWRDIILKNKDTRAFADERNKTKIVYTFLDKNTILITGNLPAIAHISSLYASRSVAR